MWFCLWTELLLLYLDRDAARKIHTVPTQNQSDPNPNPDDRLTEGVDGVQLAKTQPVCTLLRQSKQKAKASKEYSILFFAVLTAVI